MEFSTLSAFVIYIFVLLTIGFLAHRRSRSESDFVLGNRSLNFWVTAMSAHASDMSAWLFMAFPAMIFTGGMPQIWVAVGLVVGMFCNWHFVAPRLRVTTEKLDCYTLSTFFQKRFHDESGVVRIITAMLCLFFLTWYLSAGLIAMGYLFESLFGIDYVVGVTIALSVGMAYTLFGGYVTVAWVDLFQALFLFVMILIVPVVAIKSLGGMDHFLSSLVASDVSLHLFDKGSIKDIISVFVLSFGWGLGYFGQPHIITKFMGIRNPKELNKSKYMGISWQVIALAAAGSIGLIGTVFFPLGLPNSELVFVDMVKSLFHPFFVGLILCGVLAANISTMDSQMLVAASVVTEDIYRHLFKKKPASHSLLKVTRLSVMGIALVAFCLAMSRSASVSKTVYYAWTGLGCSFGPLMMMALYDNKVNKAGAISGLIVGGVMGIIWPLVNPLIISMEIPGLVPGFFLGIATIYAVSRMGKPREEVAL